jgi:hypothetical protein
MRCKRSKGRTCGAGWRNNVYKLKTLPKKDYVPIVGEKFEGCFKDAGNRDLSKRLNTGGHIKKCFEMAMDKGFKYAGLQYGGECWVGNKFGKYGKMPDSDCSMKCKRSKGRTCGNGWRNSIFSLETRERKVVEYKAIVGEKFVGCYKDAGKRDLSTGLDAKNDPKRCFELAMERGFKYAGLQYGGQCFGGNTMGKYGKVADSECSMKCRNDPSRTCGNGWRNSVFSLEKREKKAYVSIVGEKEEGCFKDAGNRDLSKRLNTGGHVKKCFEMAMEKGFKYAGL